MARMTMEDQCSKERLFSYTSRTYSDRKDVSPITTPLGTFVVRAISNEWDSGTDLPTSIDLLASGAIVSHWNKPAFDVGLLTCWIQPQLPQGMTIDGCVGCIWRLRVKATVMQSVLFSILADALPQGINSNLCTGEGLDAQEWSNSECSVVIGTEDADFLSSRARTGNWLPQRLAPILQDSFDSKKYAGYPVSYCAEGLKINLPALQQAESCQVQFVIAWKRAEERQHKGEDVIDEGVLTVEEPGTCCWFAADLRPETLLRVAGCSL